MSTLTVRDREHIFEKLRGGAVPERGLDAFAVGIERERRELGRQLDLAERGEGVVKFLRGGYGCGKTFMARLVLLEAQARGFATSFVVVSDNDLRFHRFDDVYRKVMGELGTATCPRGALGDVLDRWIGRVEMQLEDEGVDPDGADFDERVHERLDEELNLKMGGKAPADFVRVVQTIFRLKQDGGLAEAGALLSWLSGSGNVAAQAKKLAGVKGDIESRAALDYLRGALEIVKAAGYKGLVIVIDEAETILRMRQDTRHKSLNGIRQIYDAAGSYPGLLWVFTGTPDFFDGRRGVGGLAPLHERIRFETHGDFVNLRQPQLELRPFNDERLKQVALRLRDLYPAEERERLVDRVPPHFIEQLVQAVTEGFARDVGVVPRQFLRKLVNVLDLVDEHEEFDPMVALGFEPIALTSEEEVALGRPPADTDDDDGGDVPVLEDW
ncbi:MAG: BREX system ATP-binding protein BrxD [Deltaproteobacteria bacterium]|nr:MAG: BREX system ATP-binding protein BrxD [Deltaproteobacteria bacterium]